ncbi:hypothetical protein Esti_004103 [Eimeria stiedai]
MLLALALAPNGRAQQQQGAFCFANMRLLPWLPISCPWQLFLWVCGSAAAAAATEGRARGEEWGRGDPLENGGPLASYHPGGASPMDARLHHGGERLEALQQEGASQGPSHARRGAPGTVSRSQPAAVKGGFVAEVKRHRALLLALLLVAVLTSRGAQLFLTGHGVRGVEEARVALERRVSAMEENKKAEAALKKEVRKAWGSAAHKEGLVDRLREELREQEASLALEEAVLEEKKKHLSRRMAEAKRKKAVGDKEDVETLSKQLKERPKGVAADPLRRAEAELAVFDLATSVLPREKEKSMLVRELNELVRMRTAAAVLRALPAEPSTAEEAQDLLRARRMLMSSVVRVQSTAWASIMRLLELKGELQVEQLLDRSQDVRLPQLMQEEWLVKNQEQKRLQAALETLEKQLEWCLAKQQELHQKVLALGGQPPPDQREQLELELYALESFEVSFRARRAQITYAQGSGFLSRKAFLQQRACRVERARDRAAERRRRLPLEADAKLELQLSLVAVGRVLRPMEEHFRRAKELSDFFAGAYPSLKDELPPPSQLSPRLSPPVPNQVVQRDQPLVEKIQQRWSEFASSLSVCHPRALFAASCPLVSAPVFKTLETVEFP